MSTADYKAWDRQEKYAVREYYRCISKRKECSSGIIRWMRMLISSGGRWISENSSRTAEGKS